MSSEHTPFLPNPYLTAEQNRARAVQHAYTTALKSVYRGFWDAQGEYRRAMDAAKRERDSAPAAARDAALAEFERAKKRALAARDIAEANFVEAKHRVRAEYATTHQTYFGR